MEPETDHDITRLIAAWRDGDVEARETLMQRVYANVRAIAAQSLRRMPGATLSPTDLAHEALLRLLGADLGWTDRRHFFHVAAQATRQVLVDAARKRLADKRGGDVPHMDLDAALTVAAPETVDSYEIGIKSDLFDKRARISFDIYDFRVKNQQLTAVGGTSNDVRLLNADKSKARGAEFDFEALLTQNLRVTLGGAYNWTRIEDPTLSVGVCRTCTVTDPLNASGNAIIDGNVLPQAAKWMGNATLRYGIPVGDDAEFFFYTDWSYRSAINFFLYDSREFVGQPLLEGGAKLAIDGGESVSDERFGHAGLVVIGSLEPGDVLDEVEPEQQRVVLAQLLPQ
jgi:hypothetical protein